MTIVAAMITRTKRRARPRETNEPINAPSSPSTVPPTPPATPARPIGPPSPSADTLTELQEAKRADAHRSTAGKYDAYLQPSWRRRVAQVERQHEIAPTEVPVRGGHGPALRDGP